MAISIISLFFLLVKLIAFIMRLWFPLVAVLVNGTLAALYSVSVYGQVGPDRADARYPAAAAWYFRQGCGLARRYGKYKTCQLAQSSLGVTALILLSPPQPLAVDFYFILVKRLTESEGKRRLPAQSGNRSARDVAKEGVEGGGGRDGRRD